MTAAHNLQTTGKHRGVVKITRILDNIGKNTTASALSTARRLRPARRRSDALRPAEPLSIRGARPRLPGQHTHLERPTTSPNYSALAHVFLRLQVALYIAAMR